MVYVAHTHTHNEDYRYGVCVYVCENVRCWGCKICMIWKFSQCTHTLALNKISLFNRWQFILNDSITLQIICNLCVAGWLVGWAECITYRYVFGPANFCVRVYVCVYTVRLVQYFFHFFSRHSFIFELYRIFFSLSVHSFMSWLCFEHFLPVTIPLYRARTTNCTYYYTIRIRRWNHTHWNVSAVVVGDACVFGGDAAAVDAWNC